MLVYLGSDCYILESLLLPRRTGLDDTLFRIHQDHSIVDSMCRTKRSTPWPGGAEHMTSTMNILQSETDAGNSDQLSSGVATEPPGQHDRAPLLKCLQFPLVFVSRICEPELLAGAGCCISEAACAP